MASHYLPILFLNLIVVSQHYDTDVNKAYVIRGNAGILKCEIPSYIIDFVFVVSWHTDKEESFFPGTEYGLFIRNNTIVVIHISLQSEEWNIPSFEPVCHDLSIFLVLLASSITMIFH